MGDIKINTFSSEDLIQNADADLRLFCIDFRMDIKNELHTIDFFEIDASIELSKNSKEYNEKKIEFANSLYNIFQYYSHECVVELLCGSINCHLLSIKGEIGEAIFSATLPDLLVDMFGVEFNNFFKKLSKETLQYLIKEGGAI